MFTGNQVVKKQFSFKIFSSKHNQRLDIKDSNTYSVNNMVEIVTQLKRWGKTQWLRGW